MTVAWLILLGCTGPTAQPVAQPVPPPVLSRFDQEAGGHTLHTEELSISCAYCHVGARDQVRASTPMHPCHGCHLFVRGNDTLEALSEQVDDIHPQWAYPGDSSAPDLQPISTSHAENAGQACGDCHPSTAEGIHVPRAGASTFAAPAAAWPHEPLSSRRDSEAVAALQNPTPDAVEEGKRAYQTFCVSCHGFSAQRVGPAADMCGQQRNAVQAVPMMLLGEHGRVQERSDGFLFATIRDGGVLMPALGPMMTDAESWAVVAWLRHASAAPEALSAELARDDEAHARCSPPPPVYDSPGEGLFNRFGCPACHSTDGTPLVGPSLQGIAGSQRPQADGTAFVADDAYLIEAIVAPSEHISAGYGPYMPSYQGQLDEAEMAQLIAYIKQL